MLQKSDSLIRIKSDRNRFLYLNSKYVKKLSRSIASICFRISIISQIYKKSKMENFSIFFCTFLAGGFARGSSR